MSERICKDSVDNCRQCKGEYYKEDSSLEFSPCVKECPPGKYKKKRGDGDNICAGCSDVKLYFLFIFFFSYSQYYFVEL